MRVKLAVGRVYVPSFNSFNRANASPRQNKSRVGNFPDQSGLIVLDPPLAGYVTGRLEPPWQAYKMGASGYSFH